MRRIPRWLLFTAVVVLLAIGATASVSVATIRQSFPTLAGRVALPGLSGTVEVLRDAYGVPQIYANDAEDLFEAQGYVHAQDRFYEMDFRRHVASGRLSELYGASQLEADAYIRTLGWRRVAQQELNLVSPSTRRYLDAYAAGVNAYLTDHSTSELSLEYSLLAVQGLRYRPEAWTAVDSLAWLKVMAWDLGSNLDDEIERAIVTAKLGSAQAAALFPDYQAEGIEPIVTSGTVVGKAFDPSATKASAHPLSESIAPRRLGQAAEALARASRISAAIPQVFGSSGQRGEIGSNSWAVSGSRTASGKPMLSNDPHLDVSIPSVFAQVGLHCRVVTAECPFDVSGFSMAAVPGVVIGKNAQIAWGLTTSYVDTQDLYLEEVQGDIVRQGDGWVPLNVITEEIRIRGDEHPRTIRIRSTRHGPLLSDVSQQVQQMAAAESDPADHVYSVSLSWVGLTAGHTMDALFAVDQAGDFTEFRAAVAMFDAPSQNLMYADTAGNIGYQLAGAVPLRPKGDGRTPSPGWDASYDWQGLLPFDELPYAYNPPSGFLVAANQPVIGRQYPYLLGTSYSYGSRSQEIVDRLRDEPPITPDTAEQIFYDDTVRFAADLVPSLLRVKVADPWVFEGQRTLVGWDYSSAADSAAAAYFNVVVHNVLKLTFRDQLPEELWPSGGDRWYAVMAQLLKEPRNPWWDDLTTPGTVERRDDILLAAMTNARKEITSLMARDADEWQWGRLHTVTLRNQTLGQSGIGPIERLFNRGAYPVAGGPAVVNAMGYNDRLGYKVTTGPTMRMLVDLGDLDASRWVNQSGVSGHAFHRNYDDQTELWVSNQMLPFGSTRAAVDARTQNRLELEPAG